MRDNFIFHLYTTIKFIFTQQFLGSSLVSPANGLGGSRATILFLFFFSKAAAPPALRALKQKGKKEGGLGEGIFALLRLRIERFRFSLIKRNTKTENFSVLVCRSKAEASGNAPHSCSEFSLKKVRISFRIRSQIVCSAFVASPPEADRLPPRVEKFDFKRICHAPRGSKTNSRSRKIRFAVAKQQNFANDEIANLFFSPIRASCKAIIIPRSGIAQKRYY